jgi:hypothetical protein
MIAAKDVNKKKIIYTWKIFVRRGWRWGSYVKKALKKSI